MHTAHVIDVITIRNTIFHLITALSRLHEREHQLVVRSSAAHAGGRADRQMKSLTTMLCSLSSVLNPPPMIPGSLRPSSQPVFFPLYLLGFFILSAFTCTACYKCPVAGSAAGTRCIDVIAVV